MWDDLAQCHAEMAAAEACHDAPAWLIALWWLDWDAERRLLEKEVARAKEAAGH